MTERKIRPDVVSLLADLTPDGPPQTWRHDDGRPISQGELDIVLTASWAEALAAHEFVHEIADLAARKAAACRRIREITGPYLEREPGLSPVELMGSLTGAEMAELKPLLDLVAPAAVR